MADRAVLIFTFLGLVTGLFVSPYIKNIPGSQQQKAVESSDFLSAIITYTNDSPLCQKLEKHLLTVAETYKNLIRFYAVECHTVVDYACTPEVEASLPGLLLLYPQGPDPTTGEMRFFQERYTGQMHMKTFGEYLLGKMPFYGYSLEFHTMNPFIKSPGWNKTVLFTDKDAVPGLFKAMSAQFRDRLQFGVVWKNQTELGHKYNVKFYPTLLTFAGQKVYEYDGELKFDDLKWYLNLHASPEKVTIQPESLPSFLSDSALISDSGNYTKVAKSTKRLILSLFYDTDLPTDWEKMRKDYKGIVTFLQVNCTNEAEKAFGRLQGTTQFPDYLLQPLNRAIPPIQVNAETAGNVIKAQFRNEIMALDNVKTDDFLSFLRSAHKLTIVLVADEVPIAFHVLASDAYLKTFCTFMFTTNEGSEIQGGFPIKKRPGIMAFAAVGESVRVQEYTGVVDDYLQLKYYFEEVLAGFYHNTSDPEEDWEEETIDGLYDKTFKNLCGKKPSYCLIALLSGPADTEENAKIITIMKKLKAYSDRTSKPFRFAWVDAQCEFEFLRSLSLYDTQLPTVAFYQGVHNFTFPYVGEIDEVKIKLEIDKISAGKVSAEGTASLSLTDRDCNQFHRFFNSLKKVENEYRRKEMTEKFYEMEERKAQLGSEEKRKPKKVEL